MTRFSGRGRKCPKNEVVSHRSVLSDRLLGATGGFEAEYRYIKPFQLHALEHGLLAHDRAIVELGELLSVYEDAALLARARQLVSPCKSIVLLLPSPDVDQSIETLEQRRRVLLDDVEIREHFVRHHSNHDLAKITVYTKDRTPEQTCDEILERIDPAAGDIILIGPMGAGKTTLGRLLAQRLNLPQVSADIVRWGYYAEQGWDAGVQQQIHDAEGFAGVYRYWKPFEIHALERLLAEHHDCVIDLGAGHSVFEDPDHFARAARCLASYPNVVLLLPSPELDESVALLRERHTPRIDGVELLRHIITHPSHHELATLTVYTVGQTPEATRDEILRFYFRLE